MSTPSEVIMHGLGTLEAHELERLLGRKASLREAEPLGSDQYGDAAVFDLIIQATPWVAGVIGLWLLKPRKGKTLRKKLTRTDDKGQVHETEIYLHEYASESPRDAVVKALSKLFGFGTDVVTKAIEEAQSKPK